MIWGLFLGAASFTAFLLGQLLVVRVVISEMRAIATQRVLCLTLLGLPLGVVLMSVLPWGPESTATERLMAVAWGWLTHIGLFVLYMPFYYTVVASLSVRSIVLLSRRTRGELSLGALRDVFVSRDLVGQRLRVMTQNGFLRETQTGYVLARKGRDVARAFLSLKHLWRLGAGG